MHRTRYIACCLAVVLAAASTVVSQTGNSGGVALAGTIKSAEAGDADAMFRMGISYLEGRDVQPNASTAFSWLQKAAEKDHVEAQFALGRMYRDGSGVARDLSLAYKWLRAADLNGNRNIEASLREIAAAMSEQEWQQAEEDALEWALPRLRNRADSGDSQAQAQLGLVYATGTGVERDDKEAFAWYSKAAAQANVEGIYAIGEFYATGRGVGLNYVEAAKWMRAAAEKGDPRGQANLSSLYALGQGVEQNDSEAIRWGLKSAEQGNPTGQFNLGSLYSNGKGVAKDLREAAKWYEKACQQDYFNACNNLAWLLATESEIRDPVRAVELAKKAVELTGGAYAAYFDTLARAYYENGQFQEAVEAESKAVDLKPDEADYKDSMARYLKARDH